MNFDFTRIIQMLRCVIVLLVREEKNLTKDKNDEPIAVRDMGDST